MDTLLESGWHILLVSETKVGCADIATLEGRVRAAGYDIVWGQPPPLVNSGDGQAAQQKGVALLIRAPHSVTEINAPEALRPWHEDSRCVCGLVALSSGESLVCVVAYGSASNSNEAEELSSTLFEQLR